MQEKVDVWATVIGFLVKFAGYIIGIFLGLMGTFGFDMMTAKPYTTKQKIGVALVSIATGGVTVMFVEHHNVGFLKYILPSITTMFGQYIALYVAANYTKIGDALLLIFSKNQKKDDNEDQQ